MVQALELPPPAGPAAQAHAATPATGAVRFASGRRAAWRRTMALGVASGLLCAALLSGCVYRMAVQQGNFLDDKQVQQLQTGMTRAQVRFLLGTPMLPDAFDGSRWDYVYYLKVGRLEKPQSRRLSVFFEDEKVARVEKIGFDEALAAGAGGAASGLPSAQPGAPALSGTAAAPESAGDTAPSAEGAIPASPAPAGGAATPPLPLRARP